MRVKKFLVSVRRSWVMGAEGNKSKGEYVVMKGFAGSRSVALHNGQSVGPNFFRLKT